MYNDLKILVESMNFEVPLVTNMHPEPPPAGSSVAARFNGIAQGWSTTNEGEDSMEVKRIGTVLFGDQLNLSIKIEPKLNIIMFTYFRT